MSLEKMTNIGCPKCYKISQFKSYESINVDVNPELKDKVKSGDIFKYHCECCGYDTFINYPFVYHDMVDRFMITNVTTDDEFEDALNSTLATFSDNDLIDAAISNGLRIYKVRIVRSLKDFLEKLIIFDAGLDDRIIELCKVYSLLPLPDVRPEVNDIETHLIIDSDGKMSFLVTLDHNEQVTIALPEDTYQKMKQYFMPFLTENMYDNALVDLEFAINIFKTHDFGLGK